MKWMKKLLILPAIIFLSLFIETQANPFMQMMDRQYEERYSAMLLLRLEQKELAQHQQELAMEKEMRQDIQRRLLIIFVAFIVFFLLAILLFIFYRKYKAAYRELVHKSQQWAQIQPENENDSDELTEQQEGEQKAQNTLPPDDTDFLIMREIERWMTEEKVYKDDFLSVGLLAQKIGMKRHNVSIAINRCTQKSFNTFINEYRIKEAIQLLSMPNAKESTTKSPDCETIPGQGSIPGVRV